MSIEIIFKNEDYIFVNKPYDMYINSEDQNEKNTVACHLGQWDSHCRSSSDPLRFVHRLDYATSGVLCLARGRGAAAAIGRLLERRQARKYYLAVVRGCADFHCCDIEAAIGEDPAYVSSSRRMTLARDGAVSPRAASTRVLRVATGTFRGDHISFLLLRPHTGRRHQLRVHCWALSLPVLGDYTYSGGADSNTHRMFLHAIRLVLPLKDGTLDIVTKEPFLSDQRFTAEWQAGQALHPLETKIHLLEACDVIDNFDTETDGYKMVKL